MRGPNRTAVVQGDRESSLRRGHVNGDINGNRPDMWKECFLRKNQHEQNTQSGERSGCVHRTKC